MLLSLAFVVVSSRTVNAVGLSEPFTVAFTLKSADLFIDSYKLSGETRDRVRDVTRLDLLGFIEMGRFFKLAEKFRPSAGRG